jgi:hypothetical protein
MERDLVDAEVFLEVGEEADQRLADGPSRRRVRSSSWLSDLTGIQRAGGFSRASAKRIR